VASRAATQEENRNEKDGEMHHALLRWASLRPRENMKQRSTS
jgi:hypothetical protein